MIFIIFIILIATIQCVDNGLGRTPPMGWNSWNKFACNLNETVVIKTVNRIIETGLKDKGYKYINLDDCWQVLHHICRFQETPTQRKSNTINRSFHPEFNTSSITSMREDFSSASTAMQECRHAKGDPEAMDMRKLMRKPTQNGSRFFINQELII